MPVLASTPVVDPIQTNNVWWIKTLSLRQTPNGNILVDAAWYIGTASGKPATTADPVAQSLKLTSGQDAQVDALIQAIIAKAKALDPMVKATNKFLALYINNSDPAAPIGRVLWRTPIYDQPTIDIGALIAAGDTEINPLIANIVGKFAQLAISAGLYSATIGA